MSKVVSYSIDQLDVSKLPLPIRKALEFDKFANNDRKKLPRFTRVGYVTDSVEPITYEKHCIGEYWSLWYIAQAHPENIWEEDPKRARRMHYFMIRTPWVSPRVDKYIEMIRIDKEDQ